MPELRMLKQIEPNGSTKTKYMKNNGIADFIKPTLITAQQYGTKVSVEIDHSDTDIDELFEAFQTICVGLGYSDSAWKNWIVDRADEYKEEDMEEEEAIYEPSPELRKAAEAYVKVLEEQQMDKELISDFDCTLNDGLDEDEFSKDGGFDGKHVKEDTGAVFFTVPINFYTDEEGNRVYDYEGMANEFEEKLSALDTSAVVMFSVETQPLNKELIKAAAKYKKKLKI